ncbi:MAG: hypothetical protein IPK26_19640 [Planctomycetes bacterium]|nr:hypothetical protein [Planctomycetota bacterium]
MLAMLAATALNGQVRSQLPLQEGDLTDPTKFSDHTSPAVKNADGLEPGQVTTVKGAIDKICAAKDAVQPFAVPPTPSGLFSVPPTQEQLRCAIILKGLIARAWSNLDDKEKEGEIKEGDLKDPLDGRPRKGEAHTPPDRRDGGRGKYTPGDDNIIVLNRGRLNGAGSFDGAGADISRFAIASVLFHEYLHCIDNDFGDACLNARNHIHIYQMQDKFVTVLAAGCPPPQIGTVDFRVYRAQLTGGAARLIGLIQEADKSDWPIN